MPLWFKDSQALMLFLCLTLILTLLWSGLAPTLNQWHYQLLRTQYQRQQLKVTAEMTTAETDHFTYAYSQLSPQSLDLIQTESEHIFQAVNDFFDYIPDGKIPVVIYPSGEALNDRFGWEGDRSPMGVYWMGYINILAPEGWIDGSSTAQAQIFRRMGPMAHEYSHYIIDNVTYGNYPRWFSEGVAQYVEHSLGYFTTTLPAASERRLYPFAQLDRRFDQADTQTQAYWQAWLAVQYLTETYGPGIIAQILRQLAQGQSFETILTSLTGHHYTSLENALAQTLGA